MDLSENGLETLNDWTLVLKYKGSVTVTYIDFSRAFDSVSHNKLLSNLRAMAFVAAYLGGSKIYLVTGGTKLKLVALYQNWLNLSAE